MSYNPAIPNPTDKLSTSQGDLKTNFSSLNTIFGQDHYAYDAVDGGKHQHVNMPVKSGGTPPTTASGEGALYTVANSGTSDIYYCRDNETTNVYRMSRIDNSKYAQFATNTNYSGTLYGGWTFLPGGLLLQYGKDTSGSNSGNYNGTITFPKPFTTGCYSVVCTAITTTNSRYTISTGTPGLSTVAYALVNSSFNRTSGIDFSWWAIGV